jgi:hypothetical protein
LSVGLILTLPQSARAAGDFDILPPEEATENAVLSAIVVSPDRFEVVAPLLRSLRAQTICDRIEIVIVTPAIAFLHVDEALLSGFASWKAVPVAAAVSMSEARAAGVCAASCPYVVFTEDHCFPEPEWAAAIVDAFERHAADAVGPVLVNANPALASSWTFFILEYGHWMAPHPGGWMDHLPGHNSAYRRDQLLALQDNLARAIDAESALHFEWRAQGRRLWLDPQARVHHVNITNTWAAIAANCAFQRLWANSRAHTWNWTRRSLYALASPLVPAVRLSRIVSQIRRTGAVRTVLPRILPWLCLSLVASAFGEFLGYIGSTGRAPARLLEVELYRERYLAANDDGGRARFG